ncbi:hypothetical protein TRIP_D380050 [uncultured Paludibacter sp.]|uniref:Uncharacterized protein n=1 Tax=uncultured Paludibacter sp. TaxID=497635 RepID=A0A653ADE1_9BACT|nr:hypothetical protein TRIP_D380050 [uncultured Paludibacter sp.]
MRNVIAVYLSVLKKEKFSNVKKKHIGNAVFADTFTTAKKRLKPVLFVHIHKHILKKKNKIINLTLNPSPQGEGLLYAKSRTQNYRRRFAYALCF